MRGIWVFSNFYLGLTKNEKQVKKEKPFFFISKFVLSFFPHSFSSRLLSLSLPSLLNAGELYRKMVSESDLIDRLREFLRSSDLNTTTTAIVRRKLEEDFGVDLSDKKAFIREQVDLFLETELQKAQEEEAEAGDLDDDPTAKVKLEEFDGSDEEQVDESRNRKGKRRSVTSFIFRFIFFCIILCIFIHVRKCEWL